jgi:hypothetical protein
LLTLELTILQGEHQHRKVKRFWVRTNQRSGYAGRIGVQHLRDHRLNRIKRKLAERLAAGTTTQSEEESARVAAELLKSGKRTTRRRARRGMLTEDLEDTSPEQPYHMSHQTRNPISLDTFDRKHLGDPAAKVGIV